MKKIISIIVSIIIILLVLYGLSMSLDFESWIPLDIILATLLLLNSFISYTKKNDNKINSNLVMFGVIITGFIAHFGYFLWQIIDISIIIASITSIVLVIKMKNEKQKLPAEDR